MTTAAAALIRSVVFFAQGGFFAVLASRIAGLYVPNAAFLLAGAALGLMYGSIVAFFDKVTTWFNSANVPAVFPISQ